MKMFAFLELLPTEIKLSRGVGKTRSPRHPECRSSFKRSGKRDAFEDQGRAAVGGGYALATAGSGAATDRPQAAVQQAGLWLLDAALTMVSKPTSLHRIN